MSVNTNMSKILYFGSRLDRSGLSAQGDAIIKTIRPDIIVSIDSSSFNKGAIQDYGKYDGFEHYTINGFPTNKDILNVLNKGVTHAFLSESALNDMFYAYARMRRVKTFTWINPEYFDAFRVGPRPNLLPDVILLPSTWMEDKVRELLPNHDIRLLHPPIIVSEYAEARKINMARTGRRKFMHSVGRLCSKDRNGTLSLIEALKHSTADYELHIHSQSDLPPEYMTDDRRVTYHFENVVNNVDLFKDYDCCLYPRRYAGLSILVNEALCSALPVIMPRISPQTDLLPDDWLISATVTDQLQTRLLLDVYSVDVQELAAKMDSLATMSDNDLRLMKFQAYEIGVDNFSSERLRPLYNALLQE